MPRPSVMTFYERINIAGAPELGDGIDFTRGRDPSEYWFFSDRATALRSAAFVDEDILAIHEQLLGKDLSSITSAMGEGTNPRTRQVESSRPPPSEPPTGKVAVTFNGLLGDSGWGSPFGCWGAPMGYLVLNDESHRRLVNSESFYRATCTSREILRVASQPTVSDATFSMSTFMGSDNRCLLPPWMPVGRGADVTFGTTLQECFENIHFGHVPWTLLHAPVERRRFSEGELFRSASGYDLPKLMLDCINSFVFEPGAESAVGRLKALGSHVEELGSLPETDFEEFVRVQARHTNRAFAGLLEDHLRRHDESPVYWANDVRKYIDILDRAVTNDAYWLPLDLVNRYGVDDGRGIARRLVKKFGELLYWWPDIVNATSDLRAQGQRVAHLI